MNIISRIQNRRAASQTGQALILVLILLLLTGVVTVPLMSNLSSGIKNGTLYENRTNTLYAADAGVQDAFWQLNNTTGNSKVPTTIGQSTNYTLASNINGSIVTVTIYLQNSTPTYKITSIAAKTGSSTTTVNSYVTVLNGLFDVAVRALNGNITLSNNVTVTSIPPGPPYIADLAANGSISLSNGTSIYGDATATGTVTGSTGVKGTTTNDAPAYNATPIDTSVYKTESQVITTSPVYSSASYSSGGTISGNARLSGNLTLTNNKSLTVNGNLYVDGNLNLSNKSSLVVNGSLYVNGYVLSSNNCTLTIGGKLYVNSYLDTSNGTTLTLGGTTYVNGYMNLGNNGGIPPSENWLGDYAVVANGSITFNNNCNISPGGMTLLFASETGNVSVQNNCNVLSGYIYAPDGNISISNNVAITGALVANNITISNNTTVTFTKPTSSNSSLPHTANGGLALVTYNIGNN